MHTPKTFQRSREYCGCDNFYTLDTLAFCVLEETTRMTADDLDEDGAERPRLPRAVKDRRSRPGPEPTTLEAVGNQWCNALVVVQAGEEEGCPSCYPTNNVKAMKKKRLVREKRKLTGDVSLLAFESVL